MTDVSYTKNIYNKFAKEYHRKLQKPLDNFWNRFIDRPAMASLLKSIVKGKKVLDLGCGSGISTKKLASWGANVVGLDVSESLVEIARKENPNITFYVGDAKKMPFKNGQFDVVASSLMAHYIKNLKPLFKEVSRILKNKGIFVFSTHHPMTFKKEKVNNRVKYVLAPYFHNKKYTWEMLEGMELISYQHTFELIVNSLNDAGFVVERLLEPRPPKRAEKFDKKSYDQTTKRPSFCVIRAKKI